MRRMVHLIRSGPVLVPVLLLFLIFLGLPLWAGTVPVEDANAPVFMSEHFGSLDSWMPYRLFKDKKETVYTPEVKDGVSCVKAESDCSSSALVYKKEFDVYEFPVVKWKWMVANLYPKGDVKKNSTNDSPARLYILFKYEPEKAGFFTRLKYSLAKKKFGMYPPGSSLCYLWDSRPHKEKIEIVTSPAWKNSKNIVLEGGPEHLNEWRQEQINILDDYRAAFGKDPPHIAAIAIMNNSENMGGKATSWFGQIEISGP